MRYPANARRSPVRSLPQADQHEGSLLRVRTLGMLFDTSATYSVTGAQRVEDIGVVHDAVHHGRGV
jgi:hypothetical protein